MSSVQAIGRAFAVLGALADGPLGVTEVAERAGLPKCTAARLLATLAHEGAVEQVPGETRYRLGPRIVDARRGAARRPDRWRRSPTPTLAASRRRPARRPASRSPTASSSTTSTRSTRRTRRGPRLDRDAAAAPRRLVRAGAARAPAAGGRRAVPRGAARAVHAAHRDRTRTALRERLRESAATATPGRARSTPRGSRPSRRRSPTRTARSSPRSTCTARRTGSRPTAADEAVAEAVVGSAARIARSLRRT